MSAAKVYLIPCLLGDSEPSHVLPEYNLTIIESLNHFVVENEKSARRFIKTVLPKKKQSELNMAILNKKTADSEIPALLEPLKNKQSVGIISEAGMPGIADPGARLVWTAYQQGFEVAPLVGPSSIFLALAASGFNGQSFTFHGYLPIDKKERKYAIKALETESRKKGSAEIFMETPYRNNNFLSDLISVLSPQTKLCVACDITLPTEFISSKHIKDWKNFKIDLHKRPAIYIIQA
ncbi:SAM-dependent methyltransferase [Flavobacteriaceae bacterium Ap0902]|nr:SAM-dependent methyltransferase [Flavobacteriaceae bacterium Ap0902]